MSSVDRSDRQAMSEQRDKELEQERKKRDREKETTVSRPSRGRGISFGSDRGRKHLAEQIISEMPYPDDYGVDSDSHGVKSSSSSGSGDKSSDGGQVDSDSASVKSTSDADAGVGDLKTCQQAVSLVEAHRNKPDTAQTIDDHDEEIDSNELVLLMGRIGEIEMDGGILDIIEDPKLSGIVFSEVLTCNDNEYKINDTIVEAITTLTSESDDKPINPFDSLLGGAKHKRCCPFNCSKYSAKAIAEKINNSPRYTMYTIYLRLLYLQKNITKFETDCIMATVFSVYNLFLIIDYMDRMTNLSEFVANLWSTVLKVRHEHFAKEYFTRIGLDFEGTDMRFSDKLPIVSNRTPDYIRIHREPNSEGHGGIVDIYEVSVVSNLKQGEVQKGTSNTNSKYQKEIADLEALGWTVNYKPIIFSLYEISQEIEGMELEQVNALKSRWKSLNELVSSNISIVYTYMHNMMPQDKAQNFKLHPDIIEEIYGDCKVSGEASQAPNPTYNFRDGVTDFLKILRKNKDQMIQKLKKLKRNEQINAVLDLTTCNISVNSDPTHQSKLTRRIMMKDLKNNEERIISHLKTINRSINRGGFNNSMAFLWQNKGTLQGSELQGKFSDEIFDAKLFYDTQRHSTNFLYIESSADQYYKVNPMSGTSIAFSNLINVNGFEESIVGSVHQFVKDNLDGNNTSIQVTNSINRNIKQKSGQDIKLLSHYRLNQHVVEDSCNKMMKNLRAINFSEKGSGEGEVAKRVVLEKFSWTKPIIDGSIVEDSHRYMHERLARFPMKTKSVVGKYITQTKQYEVKEKKAVILGQMDPEFLRLKNESIKGTERFKELLSELPKLDRTTKNLVKKYKGMKTKSMEEEYQQKIDDKEEIPEFIHKYVQLRKEKEKHIKEYINYGSKHSLMDERRRYNHVKINKKEIDDIKKEIHDDWSRTGHNTRGTHLGLLNKKYSGETTYEEALEWVNEFIDFMGKDNHISENMIDSLVGTTVGKDAAPLEGMKKIMLDLIRDDMSKLNKNYITQPLMITRIARKIFHYSSVTLRANEIAIDDCGIENFVLVVKGGNNLTRTGDTRVFKMFYKSIPIYIEDAKRCGRYTDGLYCESAWTVWSLKKLLNWIEFGPKVVNTTLASKHNTGNFEADIWAILLGFHDKRQTEKALHDMRYVVFNTLSEISAYQKLLPDFGIQIDSRIQQWVMLSLVKNLPVFYKEVDSIRQASLASSAGHTTSQFPEIHNIFNQKHIIKNSESLIRSVYCTWMMTKADISNNIENCNNFIKVYEQHMDFLKEMGLSEMKPNEAIQLVTNPMIIEKTTYNDTDMYEVAKHMNDAFSYNRKFVFTLGRFIGDYLKGSGHMEKIISGFNTIMQKDPLNNANSKGLRGDLETSKDPKDFFGKKGYHVYFEEAFNTEDPEQCFNVINALISKKLTWGEYEKIKKENRGNYEVSISSGDEQFVFHMVPKEQRGGGREIYVMSKETKNKQQIVESLFEIIAKCLPTEMISVSSDMRNDTIHRFVSDGIDKAKDRERVVRVGVYDCKRWGPSSSIIKMMDFVNGMSSSLPIEATILINNFLYALTKKFLILSPGTVKAMQDNKTYSSMLDCTFEKNGVTCMKMPYSWMMGILNYMSSCLHAANQMYIRHVLMKVGFLHKDFDTDVQSLAHSDDSVSQIVCDHECQVPIIVSVYEIMLKMANHRLSIKKCGVFSNYFEFLSILYIGNNRLPLTSKFSSNMTFVPSCKGYHSDISTVYGVAIDEVSQGSRFVSAYLHLRLMIRMVQWFYNMDGAEDYDIVSQFGGTPDPHPAMLLIMGGMAETFRHMYVHTDNYIKMIEFSNIWSTSRGNDSGVIQAPTSNCFFRSSNLELKNTAQEFFEGLDDTAKELLRDVKMQIKPAIMVKFLSLLEETSFDMSLSSVADSIKYGHVSKVSRTSGDTMQITTTKDLLKAVKRYLAASEFSEEFQYMSNFDDVVDGTVRQRANKLYEILDKLYGHVYRNVWSLYNVQYQPSVWVHNYSPQYKTIKPTLIEVSFGDAITADRVRLPIIKSGVSMGEVLPVHRYMDPHCDTTIDKINGILSKVGVPDEGSRRKIADMLTNPTYKRCWINTTSVENHRMISTWGSFFRWIGYNTTYGSDYQTYLSFWGSNIQPSWRSDLPVEDLDPTKIRLRILTAYKELCNHMTAEDLSQINTELVEAVVKTSSNEVTFQLSDMLLHQDRDSFYDSQSNALAEWINLNQKGTIYPPFAFWIKRQTKLQSRWEGLGRIVVVFQDVEWQIIFDGVKPTGFTVHYAEGTDLDQLLQMSFPAVNEYLGSIDLEDLRSLRKIIPHADENKKSFGYFGPANQPNNNIVYDYENRMDGIYSNSSIDHTLAYQKVRGAFIKKSNGLWVDVNCNRTYDLKIIKTVEGVSVYFHGPNEPAYTEMNKILEVCSLKVEHKKIKLIAKDTIPLRIQETTLFKLCRNFIRNNKIKARQRSDVHIPGYSISLMTAVLDYQEEHDIDNIVWCTPMIKQLHSYRKFVTRDFATLSYKKLVNAQIYLYDQDNIEHLRGEIYSLLRQFEMIKKIPPAEIYKKMCFWGYESIVSELQLMCQDFAPTVFKDIISKMIYGDHNTYPTEHAIVLLSLFDDYVFFSQLSSSFGSTEAGDIPIFIRNDKNTLYQPFSIMQAYNQSRQHLSNSNSDYKARVVARFRIDHDFLHRYWVIADLFQDFVTCLYTYYFGVLGNGDHRDRRDFLDVCDVLLDLSIDEQRAWKTMKMNPERYRQLRALGPGHGGIDLFLTNNWLDRVVKFRSHAIQNTSIFVAFDLVRSVVAVTCSQWQNDQEFIHMVDHHPKIDLIRQYVSMSNEDLTNLVMSSLMIYWNSLYWKEGEIRRGTQGSEVRTSFEPKIITKQFSPLMHTMDRFYSKGYINSLKLNIPSSSIAKYWEEREFMGRKIKFVRCKRFTDMMYPMVDADTKGVYKCNRLFNKDDIWDMHEGQDPQFMAELRRLNRSLDNCEEYPREQSGNFPLSRKTITVGYCRDTNAHTIIQSYSDKIYSYFNNFDAYLSRDYINADAVFYVQQAPYPGIYAISTTYNLEFIAAALCAVPLTPYALPTYDAERWVDHDLETTIVTRRISESFPALRNLNNLQNEHNNVISATTQTDQPQEVFPSRDAIRTEAEEYERLFRMKIKPTDALRHYHSEKEFLVRAAKRRCREPVFEDIARQRRNILAKRFTYTKQMVDREYNKKSRITQLVESTDDGHYKAASDILKTICLKRDVEYESMSWILPRIVNAEESIRDIIVNAFEQIKTDNKDVVVNLVKDALKGKTSDDMSRIFCEPKNFGSYYQRIKDPAILDTTLLADLEEYGYGLGDKLGRNTASISSRQFETAISNIQIFESQLSRYKEISDPEMQAEFLTVCKNNININKLILSNMHICNDITVEGEAFNRATSRHIVVVINKYLTKPLELEEGEDPFDGYEFEGDDDPSNERVRHTPYDAAE